MCCVSSTILLYKRKCTDLTRTLYVLLVDVVSDPSSVASETEW